MWILLILIPVLFIASILGWVAFFQLRHGNGDSRRLQAAVVAGLGFPLFVMNILFLVLYWLLVETLKLQLDPQALSLVSGIKTLLAVLFLVVAAVGDYWLVRQVWKALRPERATIPLDPSVPPYIQPLGQDRKGTWMPFLIHAAILVAFLGVYWDFSYKKVSADFPDPIELPGITLFTLAMGQFIRSYALILIPVLLGIDFWLCRLAQRLGGRRLFAVWIAATVATAAIFVGIGWVSIYHYPKAFAQYKAKTEPAAGLQKPRSTQETVPSISADNNRRQPMPVE